MERLIKLPETTEINLLLIGVWFVIRALRGHTHYPRQEGIAVGFIAGLIPGPPTLFVVTALARGVPARGANVCRSDAPGIALMLGAVAAPAVLGRDGRASA